MHAMHVWGNDEQPQHRINLERKTDVGMVEQRACIQKHFKDQDRYRRRTKRHHDAQFDQHRNQDLKRMKPEPRGNVEFEIGMMHPVQTPKCRYGMEQNMLKIDRQIKRKDRDDDGCPTGNVYLIQETPTVFLSNRGQSNGGHWKHKPDKQRVYRDQRKIVRPTQKPGNLDSPAWNCQLPNRHANQHAKENREADGRFLLKYDLRHFSHPCGL